MFNSSSSTKSKRANVAGFTPDNIYEWIKALEKVPHKGDWQAATVLGLAAQKTGIPLTEKMTSDSFILTTQTPEGINNLMEKL